VLIALALAILATRFDRGSSARIALVAVECACLAVMIVATVLAIRRLDELSQRIQLMAIAVSFTTTAALATALSLLHRSGLPLGRWYDWAWPFMAIVWGVSVMVIKRRYA
jgi:hypothetical protein